MFTGAKRNANCNKKAASQSPSTNLKMTRGCRMEKGAEKSGGGYLRKCSFRKGSFTATLLETIMLFVGVLLVTTGLAYARTNEVLKF